MQHTWKEVWSLQRFRINFLVAIACLLITLYFFDHFLTYNEFRRGYNFHDPVLSLIPPVNFSYYIFIYTYTAVLIGLVYCFRDPKIVLLMLWAYCLMLLFRMLTLYILPLKAPPEIIPLFDPLLKYSFYSGRLNLKDLFFSGHTATMFLFYLALPQKRVKQFFLISTVIVGLAVMLQHIHYSIDVLAAPVFAYLAVLIAKKLIAKVN